MDTNTVPTVLQECPWHDADVMRVDFNRCGEGRSLEVHYGCGCIMQLDGHNEPQVKPPEVT